MCKNICFLFITSLCIKPAILYAVELESLLSSSAYITTDVSRGSAVVISSDGLIVTNLHTIDGASEMSIQLHDGDVYEQIDVVGFSQEKDFIILKVAGYDLSSSPLGNSNTTKIGTDIYVVGAPAGYEGTVTKGIVSSIRDSNFGHKLIQLDAAISNGSSGGGVFDEAGNLIAITVSSVKSAQNLNFAIPINYIRGMMDNPVRMSLSEFLAQNITSRNSSSALTSMKSEDVAHIVADIMGGVVSESEHEGNTFYIDNKKSVKGYSGLYVVKVFEDFISIQKWYRDVSYDRIFKEALFLNYKHNIAKIGLSGDELCLLVELPNLLLSRDAIIYAVDQLRSLNDELTDIYLERVAVDEELKDTGSSRIFRPDYDKYSPKSGDNKFTLLSGFATFYLSDEWEISSKEQETEETTHINYTNRNNGVWLFVIAEKFYGMTPDLGYSVVLQNAKNAGIVKELDRGVRYVSGTKKVYWISFKVNIEGFDFIYESNFVASAGNLIQFGVYGVGENTVKVIEEANNLIKTLDFKPMP